MVEKTTDYDEIVTRDGIAYKKFTNDPFSGTVTGGTSGVFLNGQLEGACEHYHSNGQLLSKGQYQDGLEHGDWLTYHQNGQLRLQGVYVRGKKEGSWVEYRADGVLLSTAEYSDGRPNVESSSPVKGQWVAEQSKNKAPSLFTYCIGWAIAAFSNGILQLFIFGVVGAIVFDIEVSRLNTEALKLSLIQFWIVFSTLCVPTTAGSFIVVFNRFKNLNFYKVMPYVYAGGVGQLLFHLGSFTNMVATMEDRLGTVVLSDYHFNIIFLYMTSAFVYTIYLIRNNFVKKPNRWYKS